MNSNERLHHLDNLRALAMLAGVVFHAALAYSPIVHSLFPTADRQQVVAVDALIWFLHLFRMPLFFLLAGFFAAMLVERRGLGGMLRNRLLRVALPFLLFWPLVHHAMTASTLHAVETVVHPSPLLALIDQWRQGGELPVMPPTTAHLWFLYYLMFFYALVWAARALDLGVSAAWIWKRPILIPCGVLPLLLMPALASVSAPHPAPEGLLPQFWALGFFGAFFVLGYGLHARPRCFDAWRRPAPWLAAGSVACYGVWLTLITPHAAGTPMDWPVRGLQAVLAACVSVWMSMACLGFGRAVLGRSNRCLRYLAQSAYWVYLVHLPLLLAIQYRLMDREWHWLAKFSFALATTMLLALLGYELLVKRFTPLARMLGVKPTQPKLETTRPLF